MTREKAVRRGRAEPQAGTAEGGGPGVAAQSGVTGESCPGQLRSGGCGLGRSWFWAGAAGVRRAAEYKINPLNRR